MEAPVVLMPRCCAVYYYTHIHELSKIPFIKRTTQIRLLSVTVTTADLGVYWNQYNLPHALHTKIQDSSSAETQSGYTDTTAKQYIVVGSMSVHNTNTGLR